MVVLAEFAMQILHAKWEILAVRVDRRGRDIGHITQARLLCIPGIGCHEGLRQMVQDQIGRAHV